MVCPEILFGILADECLVGFEQRLRKRIAVRIFIRLFGQQDEFELELVVGPPDGRADEDGKMQPLGEQGGQCAGRRGKAEEVQKDAAVRGAEILVGQKTDGLAVPQSADDFPSRSFARDDDEPVLLPGGFDERVQFLVAEHFRDGGRLEAEAGDSLPEDFPVA